MRADRAEQILQMIRDRGYHVSPDARHRLRVDRFRMQETWNIDAPPPSKAQRQALYKFGLEHRLVHGMTPSEATQMIGLLAKIAQHQARQWADQASAAEDLLR